MWEQQKPSLNQLLNYQPQEKEETFEQNEEFNEQLYKIDQMRTFYLQEWKPQNNWKQQYEKQPLAPEIQSEQYQEGQKKKLVVRGLHPKKKSASLPYLTNIALPIINSPSIQKYQKSRSTHQLQQALISQKFLRSRKFYQKQFDQRNLNKRFNQEKKLISQIQKQIQKYKMKQISRHSLQHRQNLFEKQKYVEQELDLINLKTKKICNMYSSLEYEKDKKKEHYLFSSKDLKPVMEQKQKKLSLVSLTPNPESHLKKLIRNYHNASMQHIRIPSRSKPETKKLQLKPKLQKAVLKRSTINKILKKYDQPTSLTPEKLSFLRDMQKQRKKQLVKDLILEKRKYTLHSQFQNFIAYAHPKDVSKAQNNDHTILNVQKAKII